ncbi:diacylglycerol kinase (macronuclear) [Tetrahymena thermophila SB210]|uniref:Diacylglycerol kinase n=1 Tax=Tetrahymena thermophila (strain SB210) TaxID=312017 RepID=I7MCS5_TETTS|nr:diacylglycerol kinase [Tetrahymena thermophila SB210]EAR84842.1 diacylglycerol kinase [Tetrahymena thermophila SB210]|eukprot:XP_001032505.1 diacylglycerol kinase [Tetrahymena thermophila SB210]
MEMQIQQEEQKSNAQDTILYTFRLQDQKGVKVDVCLISSQGFNSFVRFEYQDGRSEGIQWRDLLGAVVQNKKIDIISFPKRVQKRMFKKIENRFKEVFPFNTVNQAENVEQVLPTGEVKSIDLQEVKYIIQEFSQQKETSLFINIVSNNRVQKELLIFVNPHSGKGQAQQVFNRVKDLFEISGHSYHVVETLYRLHCFDYLYEISSEKLFSYYGIVSVSGDGTPHEIVNALLLRSDREQCLQMPIGGIHGGSGNALPTTMCNISGEYNTPECAAFIIIKNQTKKIDLIEFERENIFNKSTHPFQLSKRLYSFLSLSWTFVSDLDLGSESLRFLGETRFEVYGFWRLMFLNKYAANILFSNSSDLNLPEINQQISEQDLSKYKIEKNQLFTFFYLSNLPWVSEQYQSFPLAVVDDGLFDLIYLTNEQSRFQMIKTALALDNGSFFDKEKQTVAKGYDLKYQKVRSIRIEPINPSKSGLYSIDGERYQAEPLQGTVLPKILSVFCL